MGPGGRALVVLSVLVAASAEAETGGTVCVEHLPRGASDWAKGSMRKVDPGARFLFIVEGKPPREISARHGAIITDLDRSRRHRVEVRLDHKPYARFVLDFEGHEHLRVRFEPFYGEWHVAPVAQCEPRSHSRRRRELNQSATVSAVRE